jgi:hypothetical protein
MHKVCIILKEKQREFITNVCIIGYFILFICSVTWMSDNRRGLDW